MSLVDRTDPNHAVATGGSVADLPWAVGLFFAGWICVGLLAAAVLVRRGHDPRISYALGAGLGPLMFIATNDSIEHRDPVAEPLALSDARQLGGTVHVVVLLDGPPESVRDLEPTISALRWELATVTVALAVSYEALDAHPENPERTRATRELDLAVQHVAVDGVGRELHPGTIDVVADRVRALPRRLVLFAPGKL